MTDGSLFTLENRRVLVTGAGGLLGREFCHALSDVDATVYALDLDDEGLARVADECRAIPMRCNVTDEQDVARTIAEIASGGSIDALVTSAAVDPKVDEDGTIDSGSDGNPSTYPLDSWSRSFAVNVTGTFLVARHAGRVMAEQDEGRGRGAIVTIASTYGLVAPDPRLYGGPAAAPTIWKPIDYPATKGAILAFTRGWPPLTWAPGCV